MKFTIRAFFHAILMLLLAFPAMGFDYGGTVDNGTSLRYVGSAVFEQRDKLSLWINHYFSENTSFFAQGSYTFSLVRPYLFDLDFLRVNATLPPVFTATFGRFPFSDFSGLVLRHTLDGLRLSLNLPFSLISAGVGFSGFLLNPSSGIVMSLTDDTARMNPTVYFGSPRLVESVEAVFPELVFRQDLTLSILLQQDLRKSSEVIPEGEEVQLAGGLSGGRLNTQYFGIGVSGPIISSVYHNSFFYLCTGKTLSYVDDPLSGTLFSYQKKSIIAFLVGTGVSYYNEDLLFSRVRFNALLSSGDGDFTTFLEGNSSGNSLQFVPISQPAIGLVLTPQLGNLLYFELSYSARPFSRIPSQAARNLQTELRFLTFFRPSSGPISAPGVDSASTKLYLGSELDAIMRFRPLSDLGLGLFMGFLFPNREAFNVPYSETQLFIRFELSFSF